MSQALDMTKVNSSDKTAKYLVIFFFGDEQNNSKPGEKLIKLKNIFEAHKKNENSYEQLIEKIEYYV
jgi:hypothetical protein